MNTITRKFLKGTLTLIYSDNKFNFYPVDRNGTEVSSQSLIYEGDIDVIKREMIEELKEKMQ